MRYCPEERFDPEPCTGCGACRSVCPSAAVEMRGGKPTFSPRLCIGCGHCGAYCPVNAFGLRPLDGIEDPMDPMTFRRLMAKRVSVRKFSNKVPSDEEIDLLLSILDESPTGRNAQGLTVRVFRGAEVSSVLLEPLAGFLGALSATGIPQLAARLFGMGHHLRMITGGGDPVFRNAPVVLFFMAPRSSVTGRSDGVIAATAVMYHAVSMGMGTLWNGVAEKLYPFMGSWHSPAAAGYRLTAVLCLGYEAQRPFSRTPERDYRILSDDAAEGRES